MYNNQMERVFAMGPRNQPVVWVWPIRGVRFGSVPSQNPTRFDLAELLPGPDINLRFVGRVVPGLYHHFTVPGTYTSIYYLRS
jgi:hypothetical protein